MDTHTPRQAFIQEKADLEQAVLDMVSRADTMVAKAVESVSKLDKQLAYEAMLADDEIDRRDLDIEQRCLKMLALQQPIGSDLREVGTVLKIITDIERIGDMAVDIAKSTLKIDAEMGSSDYVDLKPMGETARRMLRDAITAFARKDATHLPEIGELEDQVDSYYRDLRDQIHAYMRSHPDQVVAASWMLLTIHHIERVADHALNIAERVGYMITGELSEYKGRDDMDRRGDQGPSSV